MARVKKAEPAPVDKHRDTPEIVDAFLDELDAKGDPKAEVARALRDIIVGMHPKVTQQVKWSAPAFSYVDYMVTMNLRSSERLMLVFHNGVVLVDADDTGLLEGDYADRRLAYFSDVAEVEAKRPTLEKVMAKWIQIMDSQVTDGER